MEKRKSVGASVWRDPDDAPELTDKFFDRADLYEGGKLVRPGRGPGRPKSHRARVAISLRVDPAVLDYFRRSGPGWQTRMHDALKREISRGKPITALLKVDVHGKPFTERDMKLIELLVRPDGASRHELNNATMKRAPARSFKTDSERLAKRVGGTAWRDPPGKGDTRRFGINMPNANRDTT